MIIDSHCHLTYEPMCSSLKETINRANNDGVKYLLTISTEDKSFQIILKILDSYSCVYGTYGIHPHEAKKHKNITTDYIMNKINENKKIIGVGETGLDFYYNHSEKKDQITSFENHIEASIKKNLPLFGICLGHQLLGLALGAKTKKMNLGHRGANHPVKNLIKGNVEITSQNHGFEIVKKSLPRNIQVTHQSLFDNSIEGIKLKSKPVFSVQYHPESNPGPQDSVYLFQDFITSIKKNAKKKRY